MSRDSQSAAGGAAQRGPLLNLTREKFDEVGRNLPLAMCVIEAFKDCDTSVLPRVCMGGTYLLSTITRVN